MTWQQQYLSRFYNPSCGWRDGTSEFHELCWKHIPRDARILEVGAGPSNPTSRFLATIGEVHGVDPDKDVLTNESLASAKVLDEDWFPYANGAFDACVSNYVIEHVPDPATHLAEVARVLRPGGVYVFRTPNRFHYVTLVSALTPHWFHELVANRLRSIGDMAHDPYPTVYAMNSRSAVRAFAWRIGFQVETLRTIEKEPSYGMSSRALFLAFMLYERAVNATEWTADLRANILAVLRKPMA